MLLMRGQAAIEYFTTYGWAFFALMIIVGILISLNLGSPNLTTEQCTLGQSLPCNFIAYNEGGVTKIAITLTNAFAYKIQIHSLEIVGIEDEEKVDGFSTNVLLSSGANQTYEGSLKTEYPENSMKKFKAQVIYSNCAQELNPLGCADSNHTISGQINSKIYPK